MKQRITLLSLIFFLTLFSFGQKKENKKNRFGERFRIENQIQNLNGLENIFSKRPLFDKRRGVFRNSRTNSSQSISSPLILKYGLDSETLQYWDETSSQLVNDDKIEYTYDNNGNLTTYLHSNWNESLWNIGWKIEYIYDAYGNLLQEIESYWWESQWQDSSKIEYTYDTNGNLTQVIEYHWSESESLWRNVLKTEYVFDAYGYLNQRLDYNWEGSQWIDDLIINFTYDSNGNLIQEIVIRWSKWTNQWNNSWKTEYTYDTNGNLIQGIDYSWNGSQWINDWKTEYTYDTNGNLIQGIDYSWVVNEWMNKWKYEYNYDANGNIIQALKYNWNGSQWIINEKTNFTYNNLYSFSDLILPDIYSNSLINIFFNHMLTNMTGYIWDSDLNNWVIRNNLDFSYSEQDILSVSEIIKQKLKIYPNPVSNVLTIKSEINPIDKVEIYSVLGKKIKTIDSDFENINTEDLSKGIYLLRINSEKVTTIKKLIKK